MIQIEVRFGTTDTLASFILKVVGNEGNDSLTPLRSFLGKTFVILNAENDGSGNLKEVHFIESK